MLFSDFMLQWLDIIKMRIKPATYSSYCLMIKKTIAPYFADKGIRLGELEPRHIQQFYSEQLKRVKANTVIHYHANIHSALKYAMKIDLIDVNAADKVDRPKKNDFMPGFYDADEMQKLFEALAHIRIGRCIRIPKINVIRYLIQTKSDLPADIAV